MNIFQFSFIIPFIYLSIITATNAKENVITAQKINLYNPQQRANSFDECQDIFPEDDPEKTIQPTFTNAGKWQLRRLCSNDFAVLYSDKTRTPLLVIEKLNAKILSKNITRTDDFFADPRLPTKQRAQLSDYRNLANIDRGHLAPARNATSIQGMAQTFAFSNIVPQNANNNRNAWKKIENDTYKFASRTQTDVYVFTGVLFPDQERTKKIGKNQIWQPSHLYKVIYHPEKNKSWAFVIANQPNQDIKQISYDEFKNKTGIKFGILEDSFSAKSQSLFSNLLTGAMFVYLADAVSPDHLWTSIKDKSNSLWNDTLHTVVSWLKENDKKNPDE